ncbi:MAG TPA: arabinan endo-1,5-alpha-L-arabinosidase [Verrucomicrobiae bacterium]|nr:arabinan endo-1,5-alpha-L-arabinosidase [Verrucomicrobiae bacterium]
MQRRTFACRWLIVLALAGLAVRANAQSPSFANSGPGAEQARRDAFLRVHDPSTIVQDSERYWTFCTGNGVRSLWSTNLVDWHFGPPVFTPTNLPAWHRQWVPANRGHFWAPDLIHLRDRWFLYYSVSSWGKNTSAIGLATNATLNPDDPRFGWHDAGMVVRAVPTNDFNTIDPAVSLDADGRPWLAFGSYWSGIKLVELDPQTGLRRAPDSPLYSLASNESIEAAYLYRQGTNYYLFVNWGQCCRGTNSTYEIRVGRSDKITGPYRDRDGLDLLGGGGSLVLGSAGKVVGPGHAGIFTARGTDWFSFHYYDATQRGRATLGIRKLRWDEAGWPVITGETPGGDVHVHAE